MAHDLSDPRGLLAELKSRPAPTGMDELWHYVISAVERLVEQPHPDFFVCERLLLWGRSAAHFESDTRYWLRIPPSTWKALGEAMLKRADKA